MRQTRHALAIGRLSAARRREAWEGYLFAAPWLLGFLLFTAGPMIVSVLMSLSSWDGITPVSRVRWVGVENYRTLFTSDPRFVKAMQNTLAYVLTAVPFGTLNALGMALLLNQEVRGQAIFRTLFYMPSVVSGVATSMMWTWLYNPSFGPINFLLSKMGVPHGDSIVGNQTPISLRALRGLAASSVLASAAPLQSTVARMFRHTPRSKLIPMGVLPTCTLDASSRNTTSRTQCTVDSMVQCSMTSCSNWGVDASLSARLVTP